MVQMGFGSLKLGEMNPQAYGNAEFEDRVVSVPETAHTVCATMANHILSSIAASSL